MSMVAGAQRTGFRAEGGSVPLAAVLGAAATVAAALASIVHLDGLGFPLCVFKATTGLPCLTCGGTRVLVRLAHFDIAGALAMNPLVALSLMALLPWAFADALLALRGRALVLEIGPSVRRVLLWAALPVILANWAYLIAVGR